MKRPADMFPMNMPSTSLPERLASSIAFIPASIPRARNDLSQSSPNLVTPTPMIATSLI